MERIEQWMDALAGDDPRNESALTVAVANCAAQMSRIADVLEKLVVPTPVPDPGPVDAPPAEPAQEPTETPEERPAFPLVSVEPANPGWTVRFSESMAVVGAWDGERWHETWPAYHERSVAFDFKPLKLRGQLEDGLVRVREVGLP